VTVGKFPVALWWGEPTGKVNNNNRRQGNRKGEPQQMSSMMVFIRPGKLGGNSKKYTSRFKKANMEPK
jgi:hypothetical protein